MPLLNDADAIYHGATSVDAVYLGDEKVWPPAVAPPSGAYAWIVGDYDLDWDKPGYIGRDATADINYLRVNRFDLSGVDRSSEYTGGTDDVWHQFGQMQLYNAADSSLLTTSQVEAQHGSGSERFVFQRLSGNRWRNLPAGATVIMIPFGTLP